MSEGEKIITNKLLAYGLPILVLALICPFLNAQAEISAYAGSASCKGCHQAIYEEWQGSHHDWAMKPATDQFVLGDFDNIDFEHYGVITHFTNKNGHYFVTTENAEGERQTFPVAYTFGFYPLQQYLLPIGNGRLQALTIAWDSRPKAEGGQRWFHLYPDERTPHGDALHWTGPYLNWNSRCAACHATNLTRNYDPTTDGYNTQWSEINIACEACHGPAQQHLTMMQRPEASKKSASSLGFTYQLGAMSSWLYGDNSVTAARQPSENPVESAQLAICGGCHSRRSVIDEQGDATAFHQNYRLQLIQDPLYHHDGQIRDEVYVFGSFLQSKMYAQGVVCSNCHNPHSLELKAPGNAVCAQCHRPDVFDRPQHHHHPVGSSGAQCVNCHMPETTYMVVDPRRDHSLRIPRPDLSATYGTPNACSQCHQDKTAKWANQALQGWLSGSGKTLPRHFSEDLLVAFSNRPDAFSKLLELSASSQLPAIIQASVVLSLQRYSEQQSLSAARAQLKHQDPMVRAAAVEVLGMQSLPQRYIDMQELINDSNKRVRLAVAQQLLGLTVDDIGKFAFARWEKLRSEYREFLTLHTDTPEGQLSLALYHLHEGDFASAERAYRQALKLDPSHLGAHVNLADLYREWGHEAQAAQLLDQGIAKLPDAAALRHAKGLLLLRQKNYRAAETELTAAVQLAPADAQYGYALGLLLQHNQKFNEAIGIWRQVLRHNPRHTDTLIALLLHSQQQQQWNEAVLYAQQLAEILPYDPQLKNLIQQLQSRTKK